MSRTRLKDARRLPTFQVEKAIFERRDLTAYEKLVLCYLAMRANREDQCWPSYATIGEDCGFNRRTAIRVINNLEAKGLVSKTRRANELGEFTSNLIRLFTAEQPAPSEHPDSGDTQSPPPVSDDHRPGDTESPPPMTASHHPGVRRSPPVVTGSHLKGSQLEGTPIEQVPATPLDSPEQERNDERWTQQDIIGLYDHWIAAVEVPSDTFSERNRQQDMSLIRKLLLDGRSLEQVRRVIEFACSDDAWCAKDGKPDIPFICDPDRFGRLLFQASQPRAVTNRPVIDLDAMDGDDR